MIKSMTGFGVATIEKPSEKINLETLTIGQALDIVDEQKPQRKLKSGKLSASATSSFRSRLKRIGIPLDTPYENFSDKDFLESIAEGKFSIDEATGAKKAVGDPYAKLVTVHNELEKYASSTNQKLDYENFGDKAVKSGIITAKQSRGTAAFEGVMEAKVSLPAIAKNIAQIEDPETRAAVAFNAFVPLRAEAVISLDLDEVDLETGYMTPVREGNKKRPKLKLTGVALELLRDQAEIAKAAGRTTFFETSTKKMTDEINAPGGLRDLMRPYADEMGREIQGVKDLRKIVPSVVAFELGYLQEASEILGHTNASQTIGTLEKMSTDHYVSRIIRLGEEPRATVALRSIQNMYAETMGLMTLNELPAALNISAKGIELSNEAIPIVREEGDILAPDERRELTPEEKQLIEDRRAQASAEIKAKTAEAETRKEVAETEKQKAIAERGPISEEAARIKAKESETRNKVRRELNEQRAEQERLAAQEARSQKNAGTQAEDPEVVAKRAEANRSYTQRMLDLAKRSKVVPFVGFLGAGIAAQQKGAEAKEAFEEGDYGTAVKRGAQAVEELVSPLPITTSDLEQMGRSPEEMKLVKKAQSSRLESMQRRSERTRSKLDEQMNNLIPQP